MTRYSTQLQCLDPEQTSPCPILPSARLGNEKYQFCKSFVSLSRVLNQWPSRWEATSHSHRFSHLPSERRIRCAKVHSHGRFIVLPHWIQYLILQYSHPVVSFWNWANRSYYPSKTEHQKDLISDFKPRLHYCVYISVCVTLAFEYGIKLYVSNSVSLVMRFRDWC